MRVVLNAMQTLDISFSLPTSVVRITLLCLLESVSLISSSSPQENAQIIQDFYKSLPSGTKLPPNVVSAFLSLWNEDAGVQECFKRAFEYQLNDSAP